MSWCVIEWDIWTVLISLPRPGVQPTLHWPLSSQHHGIPSQVTISTPSFPFILLQRIENQKNENMFQYSLEMLLCIRAVIGTLRNFTVPEKPLVMWCQKLGPPLRGSFFGRTELSFGRKKLLPPPQKCPKNAYSREQVLCIDFFSAVKCFWFVWQPHRSKLISPIETSWPTVKYCEVPLTALLCIQQHYWSGTLFALSLYQNFLGKKASRCWTQPGSFKTVAQVTLKEIISSISPQCLLMLSIHVKIQLLFSL